MVRIWVWVAVVKEKKQAKERKNEKSQLTHKKTEEQDKKKYLKK